jgi:hypothetical protein
MFTATREQRRMLWMEEEEEEEEEETDRQTDRQTVCMRADKARPRQGRKVSSGSSLAGVSRQSVVPEKPSIKCLSLSQHRSTAE